MDPMAVSALETLKKLAGIFEAYHVTTFKCYRHAKSGGDQEVTVTITDAGPDNTYTRYHVEARTADGRAASGNGAATVQNALAMVHWPELDRQR